MTLPAWDDLVAGRGCPFCAPLPDSDDFSFKVADLSVSTLRLSREQIYRGYCTLVFTKRHVTGLEQLDASEYTAFAADLRAAMQAIHGAVKPDLMNYASLGNVVPHLHYHIIPRTADDPRWGAPIWWKMDEVQDKRLAEDEYRALVSDIRAHLPL